MNPWTVLGWMLVAIVGVCWGSQIVIFIGWGLCLVISGAFHFVQYRFLHYWTRNTPVESGQLWWKGDCSSVRIKDPAVFKNGSINMYVGSYNHSESQAYWKRRVKNQKLFLKPKDEKKRKLREKEEKERREEWESSKQNKMGN